MEYYLHQSASYREEALPLTVTFNGIILRFKIRIIWHRIVNRDLKIRRRRRQRKRRSKSEFAFFQSSSRLLQVTNFVRCRWTLLKLNS